MTPTLELAAKYQAPARYQAHEEEDFAVFEDVPVFKEHVNDDGLVYDRALLEQIAENCNRRIEDTGDYTAIVLGHTSCDHSDDQPDVIGFSGPYTLGVTGEVDPKWTILATFRIFTDREQEFRRNPRRSVEIWPGDAPEERYFDPIAILGAETPQLDLGLVYSKSREGQSPDRYEMTAPGGANTFIPSATKMPGKHKPDLNHKETDMSSIAPQEMGQLIEALKPTIVQIVNEAMPATETAPPPMPEGNGDFDRMSRYMKGDEDDDHDFNGAVKYMEAAMDDDDRDKLHKYMEGCEDGDRKEMYDKLHRYMASDGYAPGSDYSDPDQMTPKADHYSKEQYGKLREKYRKLDRDHITLKTRYAKQEAELVEVRQAERYAKRESSLTDLGSRGFVLDVAEELESTNEFSDDQFTLHCEKTIAQHYQRVPGGVAPVPGDPEKPMQVEAQAEQYGKEAKELCLAKRENGEDVSYREVLGNLQKNKGAYVAA